MQHCIKLARYYKCAYLHAMLEYSPTGREVATYALGTCRA